MNKHFNLELPKWPCLLVHGKPVTKGQAMEIIIRTSSFSFSSNDGEFEKDLHEALYGVRCTSIGFFDVPNNDKLTEEKRIEYKLLNTYYLRNRRILSSFIGGPHGWCNWDGQIFCNTFNIGKYPSVESVYDEWVEIAKEFPYLQLTSQLLNGESCQDNLEPVIEYKIKNGKVRLAKPKHILIQPHNDVVSNALNLFAFGRERGCSINTFKEALMVIKTNNSKEKIDELFQN
jgi:hypothetical protein